VWIPDGLHGRQQRGRGTVSHGSELAAEGPSGRAAAAMVYDSKRQEIVLFGGQGAAAADGQLQALYGDTWVWNGRTWRNASNVGPSARAFHTMSFDRRAGFVLMHGGEQRGVILDDLWAWDGPAGGSCRSPALRRESAGCTLWLTMRVGRGPSSTVAYAATPTATPVPTTTRGNGTGGGGTASGDVTPIE
jgi:Galactose oxidase, central domain